MPAVNSLEQSDRPIRSDHRQRRISDRNNNDHSQGTFWSFLVTFFGQLVIFDLFSDKLQNGSINQVFGRRYKQRRPVHHESDSSSIKSNEPVSRKSDINF